MAGPATATSRGLRWDVCDTALRVGGLVSSSNLLTGRPVEVVTDAPLLWTTELRREPRLEAGVVWARAARAEAEAMLGKREAGLLRGVGGGVRTERDVDVAGCVMGCVCRSGHGTH